MSQQQQQQREVRTVPWWRFPGWQMAGAGALHGFFGYGFWLYGWSAFVPLLRRRYNFTAFDIGVAATASRLDGGIEGIFTGWALDKWGPRFTAVFGFVYCSIGYLVIANLPEGELGKVLFWVFRGLVIMNAMGIALYTTSFPAMSRWFVRRRANAMGVITVGTGLGGTVLTPLTQWLLNSYGLAGASYVMIAANLLILAPSAWVFFRPHHPEHYGFLPDNVATEVAETQTRLARAIESRVKMVDFTLGQAFRTYAFWGIIIAGSLAGVGSVSLMLFQNERMQGLGYSAQTSANFYGLQLAMTTVGRGLMALFGEMVDPYHVMWVTHLLMAFGMLSFAVGTQDWHFYTWAILYGIPFGAYTPTIGALRGAYFGRAHQGKIYGWINAGVGTGGVFGPILVGWLIDIQGYDTTFLATVGFYFAATVAYIIARRPGRQPSPMAIKQAAKEAEEEFRRSQPVGGS